MYKVYIYVQGWKRYKIYFVNYTKHTIKTNRSIIIKKKKKIEI